MRKDSGVSLTTTGDAVNQSHPGVDVFQQIFAGQWTDVIALDYVVLAAILLVTRLPVNVDVSHVSRFVNERGGARCAWLHEVERAQQNVVQVVCGYRDKIVITIITLLDVTRRSKHVLTNHETFEFRLDSQEVAVERLKRYRLFEGFFRLACVIRVSAGQV